MLAPWKESCDKPGQCIKKQRQHFADKGLYSQSYGFSNSQVQFWEVDHQEGRAPNNWCFRIVVLEKTLEIPLDSKEIKPVNPRGNQHWILIGRTDAEAEAPILWLLDVKNYLIGEDPDAGKEDSDRGISSNHLRLEGITDSMDMGLSKLQVIVKDR